MTDPLGLINNSSNIGAIQSGRPLIKPAQPEGPGFKDVLMKNLEQVSKLQEDAEIAVEDLMSGRRSDPETVMMAKEKADIAFQMLLQVRNKLSDAYEEVKQIRV